MKGKHKSSFSLFYSGIYLSLTFVYLSTFDLSYYFHNCYMTLDIIIIYFHFRIINFISTPPLSSLSLLLFIILSRLRSYVFFHSPTVIKPGCVVAVTVSFIRVGLSAFFFLSVSFCSFFFFFSFLYIA